MIDLFIPTLDESPEIVDRAICSALSLAGGNEPVIWILDDGDRIGIELLARLRGVEYLSRSGGANRKAGNLNWGLENTTGSTIAVIDCDAVVHPDFLSILLPYLDDPKVAMVQAGFSFFNPDCSSRNAGAHDLLPHDLAHFVGYIQPARAKHNATVCCGTGYLVKREALEIIGGWCTKTQVEDHATSLRLQMRGYQIAYEPRILSWSESPRTYADLIAQRRRWHRSNIQIFLFIPFWGKHRVTGDWCLSIAQKAWMLNLLSHLIFPLTRLGFLIIPVTCVLLGISPLVAPVSEWIYYAAPLFILHFGGFGWSTGYLTSAVWADVFETVQCYPLLLELVATVRSPWVESKSRVTPKGTMIRKRRFNWGLTWPLWGLLGVSVLAIALQLGQFWLNWFVPQGLVLGYEGQAIAVGWTLYNTVILIAAILCTIDRPTGVQRHKLGCFGVISDQPLPEQCQGVTECTLVKSGGKFVRCPEASETDIVVQRWGRFSQGDRVWLTLLVNPPLVLSGVVSEAGRKAIIRLDPPLDPVRKRQWLSLVYGSLPGENQPKEAESLIRLIRVVLGLSRR